MIHRHQHAEIQAIGRSAVEHAERAIARATVFLEEEDITVVSRTWNIKPGMDGNKKEGIRFILRVVRGPSSPPGPQGSMDGSFASVPTGPFEGTSMTGFTRPASKQYIPKEGDTAGTGGSAVSPPP